MRVEVPFLFFLSPQPLRKDKQTQNRIIKPVFFLSIIMRSSNTEKKIKFNKKIKKIKGIVSILYE